MGKYNKIEAAVEVDGWQMSIVCVSHLSSLKHMKTNTWISKYTDVHFLQIISHFVIPKIVNICIQAHTEEGTTTEKRPALTATSINDGPNRIYENFKLKPTFIWNLYVLFNFWKCVFINTFHFYRLITAKSSRAVSGWACPPHAIIKIPLHNCNSHCKVSRCPWQWRWQ